MHRSSHRYLADATGHRRQQDALGVDAVQDVLEPAAPLAHHSPTLYRQPVVGHFARGHRVAAGLWDRANVYVLRIEIYQEQTQSVQPIRLVVIGANQQQHHL